MFSISFVLSNRFLLRNLIFYKDFIFSPGIVAMMNNKAAYPEPLPTEPPRSYIMSPYSTLYQGLRYKNDTRVFRKKFDYAAKLTGQQLVCQGLFDCLVSVIGTSGKMSIQKSMVGWLTKLLFINTTAEFFL